MSQISNNPLRQAGFHDIGQPAAQPQGAPSGSASVPIAQGHAPANSNIQGHVAINNAPAANGGGAAQAASQSRLSQLGSALGAPFRALASAIDKKLFEPARTAENQKFDAIQLQRENLRKDLGGANANSILHTNITTSEGTHSVETFMKAYVASLHGKSNVTVADAMTFVRMGERIVTELYKGSDADFKLPLTTTVNGQQITIPSNLDTTRAVSWFLQAKGMADNAAPGRDNVQLHSGSMTVGDPGNRLYKYLSSAPNCYGRCSSHHERRSAMDGDRPATATKGLTAPLLHGIQKQPMQNGIEDFTNQFPSNGGTLLFDKLKNGAAGGEIFLKWEEVGMPDAIGSDRVGKHGDTREEKATFTMAAGRCKGHLTNFLNRHSEKAGVARGEQAAKLFGKQSTLIKDFQSMIKNSDLSSADKKAFALDKNHQDVQNMYEGLGKLMRSAADKGESIEPFKAMLTKIANLDAQMGNDMGILRSGAEMHVRLP